MRSGTRKNWNARTTGLAAVGASICASSAICFWSSRSSVKESLIGGWKRPYYIDGPPAGQGEATAVPSRSERDSRSKCAELAHNETKTGRIKSKTENRKPEDRPSSRFQRSERRAPPQSRPCSCLRHSQRRVPPRNGIRNPSWGGVL